MNIRRGVLRTLEVPWKLTQAVTRFGVVLKEGGECIVSADADDVPDQVDSAEPRRIDIVFHDPAHVVVMSAIGTRDSVDLDQYDLSLTRLDQDEGAYDRLREEWITTRICPNPWAFRVDESTLLHDLQLPADACGEFLLVGDDYSVIVVARGFSWSWSAWTVDVQPVPLNTLKAKASQLTRYYERLAGDAPHLWNQNLAIAQRWGQLLAEASPDENDLRKLVSDLESDALHKGSAWQELCYWVNVGARQFTSLPLRK